MAFPNKKPAMALMVSADKSEPDHDEAEFKAPEGFDVEGKKPGDTVEAVVELEIKEGGMLCVRKLNGIEVGSAEKPPEDQPPDEDSFLSAVKGSSDAGEEQPTGEAE